MNLNNTDSDIIITGTAQADNIENYGSKVKVNGEAGDDTIQNEGDTVSINAGDGTDYISNNGYNVTINGGTGNDTIVLDEYSYDNLIQYSIGDGNDLIQGFNENSTLKITSGSIDNITSNDSDIFIAIGGAVIFLENALDSEIFNIIDANGKPANFDFNGTSGNDFVNNRFSNVTIKGNSGNDSIKNYGNNVTISGGNGNDTIVNSGEDVLFVYSDGNDLIQGFNETDTLQVTKGTVDKAVLNGRDIVLTIGQNSITFADTAEFENINIIDTEGKTIELGGVDKLS